MELNISVNGRMINKMELVKRFGLIKLVMRENTYREESTVKEFSNGLMVRNIEDSFNKIIYMEMESTNGKMEENMLDNGKIIEWMAEEYLSIIKFRFLLGMMAENMKENIKMIESMDMVYLHGLMEE